MGGDDDRKRQGPGADLFEQARHRAEAFLREVSNLGGSTQQQAGERVDQLWSVGRWSADQLMEAIRREIASQLTSLGLATKADLDALERRLTSGASDAGPAGGAAAEAVPGTNKAAKKTAATKPAATKTAAAKKNPAKKAAPGPAAARPAPPRGAPEKAATKKAAAKMTAAQKAAGSKKAAGS
ncbi:MAG TPA: hypothetical protein VKV06_13460 [Acidimicrobiales bacterium]|nr:hypothetical protein [Acidimicrobiales bacterium]